jgi:hypothetical protein
VSSLAAGAVVGAIVGLIGGYIVGAVVVGDNIEKTRHRKGLPRSMPTGEVLDEMTADKVAVMGVTLIVGGLIGAAVAGESPSVPSPQIAVK